VRLVQVREPAPSSPVVTAFETFPLPPQAQADPLKRTAAAAALVRQALRSGRFTGHHVVTHLPREYVHLRTFRLAADADTDAVRRQALEGAPFAGTETAQVRAVAAGQARQGRDVRTEYLAAAARDADVQAVLEQFGGGITVHSLRAEPFAIYAAAARVAPEAGADETHAVVHVGPSETLVLIGSGAGLTVIRRVDVGGAQFDHAVSRKLGVTPADARTLRARAGAARGESVRGAVADAVRPQVEELVHEAATCVRYHAVTFRAAPPRSVRLLGPESFDPHVRVLLGAATGLPVEGLGTVQGLRDDDGGWAAALGLAMPPCVAAEAPAAPAVAEVACA
jgi:Tfp pilus assembly PilM family ATPase